MNTQNTDTKANESSLADYTPTRAWIREAYFQARHSPARPDPLEVYAEFDRWLKQIKAAAFEEGYDYASNGKWGNLEPGENPYE